MRLIPVLVLAFSLFACVAPAFADPPSYISAERKEFEGAYGPQVADTVFSEKLTETRAALIAMTLKDIPDLGCPAEKPPFQLYDLYPFEPGPKNLAWIERYKVSCAKELRRALFWFREGDGVKGAAMAPGASIADVRLQVDATVTAKATAAQNAPKDCAEVRLIDTAVTETPSEQPAWKERWSFLACGAAIPVDLAFSPAPDGGTTVKASLGGAEP